MQIIHQCHVNHGGESCLLFSGDWNVDLSNSWIPHIGGLCGRSVSQDSQVLLLQWQSENLYLSPGGEEKMPIIRLSPHTQTPPNWNRMTWSHTLASGGKYWSEPAKFSVRQHYTLLSGMAPHWIEVSRSKLSVMVAFILSRKIIYTRKLEMGETGRLMER